MCAHACAQMYACVLESFFPSLFEVNRIAAAFGLQSPIFLVKDQDNTAIFPHELSGHFFSSCITPATTYSVNGTSTSDFTHATSFGSYPHANFSRSPVLHPPPHPPPTYIAKKIIKKAITLASLSLWEQGSSAKNKMQYATVTTVNIGLDPTQGSVPLKPSVKRSMSKLDLK